TYSKLPLLPRTLYRLASSFSQPIRSDTGVHVKLSFAMAASQSAFFQGLSSDTPSTVKFLSLNLSWAARRLGFSSRQGTHQLAQKSISTYFPLKSVREIGLSSGSFCVNRGLADQWLWAVPGPSVVQRPLPEYCSSPQRSIRRKAHHVLQKGHP